MNRKIIIGIVFVILAIVSILLLSPVSATEKYRGCENGEVCTAVLINIPRWKLVLFDLTGIRTGYSY